MSKIYVVILSVVALAFTLTSGVLLKYSASKNLLDDLVTKNNNLIENYLTDFSWENLLNEMDVNEAKYFEKEEYKLLTAKLKNMSVAEIIIHSPNAKVIITKNNVNISTDSSNILDKLVASMLQNAEFSRLELFNKAMQGISEVKLLPDVQVQIKDNVEIKTMVQSFTSIKLKDNRRIVIEIYHDISNYWHFLTLLQFTIAFIMILVFVIMYTFSFIISFRAQKIIDKQIEANLELEEAKVKAEELNKQKSQFFANMSHELRTPLNSILGFSEMIKNETLGPIPIPQYKDYASDIHSSGSHLLEMINDILDFSKAEADKLQVEKIEVDATKTIKQSIRIVQQKADAAKINIVDQTASEHFMIVADPKRFKQVLLNILSNSIKFTPENGKITIKSKIDEINNLAVIEIADTGIGIDAKDIAKVMSPFGQINNSLSKKHDGTGLGLPLTKKLVELMNGKFHIESEPSLGTRVIITFSLYK